MKARQITITQADEGYIVTVGCQTVVREDRHRLIADLAMYLANPEAYEKEYYRTHPDAQGPATASETTVESATRYSGSLSGIGTPLRSR